MIVDLVQMIVLVRIIARTALAMMTVGVKIFAKIIAKIETVLIMKIALGMMTVDAKTIVAVALMVAIKTSRDDDRPRHYDDDRRRHDDGGRRRD
jgi:hypothetical protein